MRINRIHLRAGGDAEERQLAFYPGYTVVLAPGKDEAMRLSSVLCALLYPDAGLRALQEWTTDSSGHASVNLELGSAGFQVSADFGARRIELLRYDSAAGRYEPLCAGARLVAQTLRRAGLPNIGLFRALCTHGIEVPLPAGDVGDELPEEDLTPRPASETEVARAEARVLVLRAERDALGRLEQEYKEAFGEIESRALLAELFEDSDSRLAEYREHLARLARAREHIRQKRRELLDDRARLTGAPRRYILPALAALVFGAAGGVTELLGLPIGLPILTLGFAVGGVALLLRLLARRRLRKLEVGIAALRVRERREERAFEAKVEPIRALMTGLGIGTPEEIEAELAQYGRSSAQLDELHQQLTEGRIGFPPEAQAELARLEEILSRPDALERLREKPAIAAPDPVPPVVEPPVEIDCSTPQLLIEGVARALRTSESALHARLEQTLGAQLAIMTEDAFDRANPEAGDWVFRGPDCDGIGFSDLSRDQRDVLMLGFQIALIDTLATDRALPLFVGPDAPGLEEGDHLLGRALRRAGATAQVLHFAAGEDHWSDHAARTLRLS